MTAATQMAARPSGRSATTRLLGWAFAWSALVFVGALILGLRSDFGVAMLIGLPPIGLWTATAGWVALGARSPRRAPNLLAIGACALAMLGASVSFIGPLLLAMYPTAVLIVVAAALNLSRRPR